MTTSTRQVGTPPDCHWVCTPTIGLLILSMWYMAAANRNQGLTLYFSKLNFVEKINLPKA